MAKKPTPAEVTALLDKLSDYVAEIHWRWQLCKSVFGRSAEDIRVLNRRTGRVFRGFQVSLIDSILLEIAKLFDPATMGRTTNPKRPISLYRAFEDLDVEPAHRTKIQAELTRVRKLCEPIIGRRHTLIAHNDSKVATGAMKPAEIRTRLIAEAIGGVTSLVDRMSMAHNGVQRGIDRMEELRHEAETLIQLLATGNAHMDDERAKRLQPRPPLG